MNVGISASSSCGKGSNRAIALEPGIDQLRHVRLVLEERDGGCRVVHMPAEAAVVEVDDFHLLAVDEQVGKAQVAVDEAEAVGALAVALEPAADEIDGPAEQFAAGSIDAHPVAPAPPSEAASRGSFRSPT